MQNYIPFQLRTLVIQIDPSLDMYWEDNLRTIFTKIDPKDQENIFQQILQPKDIRWDREQHHFSHHIRNDLESIIKQIPHTGMKTLAQKILLSLEQLKQYNSVIEVADYLESILNQIDKIDVEENIELQRLKLSIRKEFIYAAGAIIKNKSELIIPPNYRNLTLECVKSFILEVYLKQQLLGFWFKTLRPRHLKGQSHPLFNEHLLKEQKIRQLEVVKTSKFIFALAPSRDLNVNPFSIRRFLLEEKIAFSHNVYLNGVAFDLTQLQDNNATTTFLEQISRIITIEKLISQQIIDLIDKFELYSVNHLFPLLFQPLDASGLIAEKVVQQRLWDFEQMLSVNILEPLENALRHIMQNNDEAEYLFISMRQLLADIISYYKDFQSQPAIMFDQQADLFSARLTAYLTLISKRKYDVFVVSTDEDWLKAIELISEPIAQLKTVCKDGLDQNKVLVTEIKEKQRSLKEKENSFFSKILNNQAKVQAQLDDLKHQTFTLKENTYFEIVRIPKKYPSMTVYLEFESLISLNDKERHYAFPTGKNWITRLPILVQLPEDRSLFNPQELYRTMEFDLSKMNQKWTATMGV